MRDFHYFEETLYQKRSGEFFLYGLGGPASKYAEYNGNGWEMGEKIMPMTVSEAKEWAEKNLDADEYETIFGDVSEASDTKRTVTFSLTEDVIEKIRMNAANSGVTMSDYIASLVRIA
jgi:predicted DNA binding CopG/RHH family protein